jgi:hypothetical protein
MEPSAHPTARFTVRQYQPADRDAVRDLCCRTGFLGNAVDPVFEDGDLFASFLTDYYLECEPDSVFVVTVGDAIKGVQIPPGDTKGSAYTRAFRWQPRRSGATPVIARRMDTKNNSNAWLNFLVPSAFVFR